jgi:hypothetical protein
MNDLFERIDSLALDKSELCMLGRFCRAFLEKAPVITEELFPYIESSVDCQKFQSKIMRLYTENHENERQQILHEMKDRASHPDVIPFYAPQLDEVNRKLEVKTFLGLLDSIENRLNKYSGLLEIFNNSYKNIHGSEDSDYIRDNYKYYYIGSLLYGSFESARSRTDVLNFKYSSVVFDEYQRIGLDLSKVDNQFLKYNLISLNDNISINNDKDSQTILDSRINKYFWINIPRKLLFSIEELIEKKLISEISFRIDYVSESILVMEEMEFGSTLKLEISTLPELSKFYSTDNYENNLWVRHDKEKRSLTFEELLKDFEIVDDNIVTQVVHIEYFLESDESFINHLDHEFIVYDLEEYQKRQSNPEIKGHKKVKTFKIDNSKIPFKFKNGNEYFLFQVLDAYLKNTDLVSEYFEKI